MTAADLFDQKYIVQDFEFENFGYIDNKFEKTLTYLFDEKYILELHNNINISGVITTNDIAKKIIRNIGLVICDDPVSLFYSIFIDFVHNKKLQPTQISENALISENAMITKFNVTIEDDVIIEDGVIIKQNVVIKKGSVIRSGAILGSDGFEVKSIYGKQKIIPHDGKVIICENVDIGNNSCIDRGIFGRDTIIGNNTKIDNLCHIAHGVQIGRDTIVAAKAMVGGSCIIGNNVWIGPGSNISNGINIADDARVTIGSTVLRDVKAKTTVTGYFAQEHKIFLRKYLNLFRK